jgi:hypothetical protein
MVSSDGMHIVIIVVLLTDAVNSIILNAGKENKCLKSSKKQKESLEKCE